MQTTYAQGDMAQYLADNPTKVKIHLFSAGSAVRIDKPFAVMRSVEIAPFIALGVHYQRYFRDFTANYFDTAAIAPEVGMNTYYAFGPSP